MSLLRPLRILLLAMVLTHPVRAAEPPFEHFVTTRGDQLMDGDEPVRFISWNIPNLLMIEDNVPFSETNPWRVPEEFELTDALSTVRQMGSDVARTYVITVRRSDDAADTPRHVLGPGQFDEEVFRSLDLALKVANGQGVRLIIPFVDNWPWMGGRAEYAAFRGKTKDEFWTDRQLIEDFKQTIHFIITRTNTLTGVPYSEDKAILCWETGNEVQSPPSWTREIAAYIKSLDPNHLVMDGYHSNQLREDSLEIPEVDIVTTHHYPGGDQSFATLIRENWAKAKGRKPYVVGEFGFVETPEIIEAIQTIQDTGVSGGLLWSLRFRNRDGGFYWHSEPSGGNRYKAFHWPGSEMGAAYDEVALMAATRAAAFAIRGQTPPPIPAPASPTLIAGDHPGVLRWRGSVGASGYSVERAEDPDGPWTVVAENVPEDFVQYRPLYIDQAPYAGDWFYRVRATNREGTSPPSNIIGPMAISHVRHVDELADFDYVTARSGSWELRSRDCRQAKEDAHRAAGAAGASLTYQMPASMTGFRVFAFFPSDITDVKLSVSEDGETFHAVDPERHIYFEGEGDYAYWKPVEYRVTDLPSGVNTMRLELAGETQIGRVEIDHEFE